MPGRYSKTRKETSLLKKNKKKLKEYFNIEFTLLVYTDKWSLVLFIHDNNSWSINKYTIAYFVEVMYPQYYEASLQHYTIKLLLKCEIREPEFFFKEYVFSLVQWELVNSFSRNFNSINCLPSEEHRHCTVTSFVWN